MTYIDYLNAFNQWTENNQLPIASKVMYYGLLHIFNRCMWPEWVQVSNQRLMRMIDTRHELSVIRTRERLTDAGLISYERGKKGSPGKYKLNRIPLHYDVSVPASDSVSVSVSEPVSEPVSHNKNKTKTDTPPLSPGGSVGHKKNPAGQDMPYGAELCRSYIPSSRKSSWSSRRSKVRVTLNRSPSISMAIFPPCSSASDFAMLRPRPLPSV